MEMAFQKIPQLGGFQIKNSFDLYCCLFPEYILNLAAVKDLILQHQH